MLRRELPSSAQKHAQVTLSQEIQPHSLSRLFVLFDEFSAVHQSHPARAQRLVLLALGCHVHRARVRVRVRGETFAHASPSRLRARSARIHGRRGSTRLDHRLQSERLERQESYIRLRAHCSARWNLCA